MGKEEEEKVEKVVIQWDPTSGNGRVGVYLVLEHLKACFTQDIFKERITYAILSS